MSQGNNRYSVLEFFESNQLSNLQAADTVSETMSSETLNPSSNPSFPEKIYVRSTNSRFSTQVKVILKTLDTGNRISITALLDC